MFCNAAVDGHKPDKMQSGENKIKVVYYLDDGKSDN